MSRVRSKHNQATELKLAALLRTHGITGWRRNSKLFGKPDFVLSKKRIAVFVDGEFWHGHPVRGQIPKTNSAFWNEKIRRNKRRDLLVNRTLRDRGWTVVRIWQNELADQRWHRKMARALGATRR